MRPRAGAVPHRPAKLREDDQTADEVHTAELSSRRTDPRGSSDLAPQRLDWRSAPAPKPVRERRTHPSPRMLAGAALVVTAAAVWIGVIAIASHKNDRPVSSHSASFVAATSAPSIGFLAAAKTVRTVLGAIEQQARKAPARDRVNRRRAHPRRRTRHVAPPRHSRPSQSHSPSQAAPQIPTGTSSQTATAPSASTAGWAAAAPPVASARAAARAGRQAARPPRAARLRDRGAQVHSDRLDLRTGGPGKAMTNVLAYLRQHVLAALALVCSLLSLGGASYAAFSLPAGSVGARQLQNHAITPVKLNPTSVAASVRAWANLTWAGGWRVQASSRDIRVTTVAVGELVTWRHTRFASNCMSSVTPQRNFGPGAGRDRDAATGTVSTSFDPRGGQLQIDGISADARTRQAQAVTILIVCPSPGSQKVGR